MAWSEDSQFSQRVEIEPRPDLGRDHKNAVPTPNTPSTKMTSPPTLENASTPRNNAKYTPKISHISERLLMILSTSGDVIGVASRSLALNARDRRARTRVRDPE